MTNPSTPTKKIKRKRRPVVYERAYYKPDPENRSATRGLEADAVRIATARGDIDKIEQMLRTNHESIQECADLLNRSQPPTAGKIEIRWWKVSQGPVSPVVVQWRKDGKVVRIDWHGLQLKANSRGPFNANHSHTKEILAIVEKLFTARERMLKKLTDLTLGRLGSEKYHDALTSFVQEGGFTELFRKITSESTDSSDAE